MATISTGSTWSAAADDGGMPPAPGPEALSLLAGSKTAGLAMSNLPDCRRFGCDATPWNWASRWILERARLSGREIVCDLGAGQNPVTLPVLAAKSARTFLIDRNILPARAALPENLCPVRADISQLPLDDSSVDRAISISVLEHLPPDARVRALREAARILKPGGLALFSIGLLLRVSERGRDLVRELPFFADRGCSCYPPVDFRLLLASVPELHLTSDCGLETCPGFSSFDEERLLADPRVCLEPFAAYPQLAADPDLRPIVVVELAVMLIKEKRTC